MGPGCSSLIVRVSGCSPSRCGARGHQPARRRDRRADRRLPGQAIPRAAVQASANYRRRFSAVDLRRSQPRRSAARYSGAIRRVITHAPPSSIDSLRVAGPGVLVIGASGSGVGQRRDERADTCSWTCVASLRTPESRTRGTPGSRRERASRPSIPRLSRWTTCESALRSTAAYALRMHDRGSGRNAGPNTRHSLSHRAGRRVGSSAGVHSREPEASGGRATTHGRSRVGGGRAPGALRRARSLQLLRRLSSRRATPARSSARNLPPVCGRGLSLRPAKEDDLAP
jgi:hypothetical protein